MEERWKRERDAIMGMGDTSFRKSYYPDLQEKIAELEEVNRNMIAVFSSARDSIVIFESDGRILFLNHSARHLLQLTGTKPASLSFFDLCAGEHVENIRHDVAKVLQGESLTLESQVITYRDREAMDVQISFNALQWERKPAMMAVLRDFTERIRYEKALFDAKQAAEESDRLKSVFLKNMSHEIRTPLNGIMGFTDLLNRPDFELDNLKEYTRIIRSSSLQLLRIIEDILEISMLESTKIEVRDEEVNLNALLTELYDDFELRNKNHAVELRLSPALPDGRSVILADPKRLNRMLFKLIDNALKFTEEGAVELGYYIEKNELVIYVRDTGIGVSAPYRERIFERFMQEHREIPGDAGGLGLGLSIARENARLIGGRIELDSEKGQGSIFRIHLDYRPGRAHSFASREASPEKSRGSALFKLLVAEDEEINFLYLRQLLSLEFGNSMVIFHARDGREAVRLCEENHPFDLVLMDIRMPGMNGIEATRLIKSKYPQLRVVAQTAYLSPEMSGEMEEAGFDDVLSKPLDGKTLILQIRNHYL